MGGVPDSDELNRMMVEIGAGWEWGDPRSKVPQTPEHEASWGRLKVQMREIADQGGIVEIPGEFPDLSDYKPGVAGTVGRKKPTPERRPSRNESEEPKEQAKSSDPDQVKRTYLGKEEIDGTVSALYMMERGPGYLIDRVLHADGWVATLTLTDWRVGERSDIDIITPTVAKKTAEEWDLVISSSRIIRSRQITGETRQEAAWEKGSLSLLVLHARCITVMFVRELTFHI